MNHFPMLLWCVYWNLSEKHTQSKDILFSFPKRLPFNCKTPFGFILYTVFASAGTLCILFNLIQTTCFFIGSCWLYICLAKNLRNDLSLLNVHRKAKERNKKIKECFCQIVQNFADVKELSGKLSKTIAEIDGKLFFMIFRFICEFSDIYEYMLFFLFLWTLLSICSCLLLILAKLVEYTIRIK